MTAYLVRAKGEQHRVRRGGLVGPGATFPSQEADVGNSFHRWPPYNTGRLEVFRSIKMRDTIILPLGKRLFLVGECTRRAHFVPAEHPGQRRIVIRVSWLDNEVDSSDLAKDLQTPLSTQQWIYRWPPGDAGARWRFLADTGRDPNRQRERDEPPTELEPAFVGDTDRTRTGTERREQTRLRKALLGPGLTGTCALCGQTYPTGLLRAAHIKMREECTAEERRDLGHIAMIACTLGCDALYEAGLIAVDAAGQVLASTRMRDTSALAAHARRLAGSPCAAHTRSRRYFAWHRKHRFQGQR
jgi:hypothetical protein